MELWIDEWLGIPMDLVTHKVAKRSDIPDSERSKKRPGGPFADTVNQRYQLGTADHVRAAWSYINMPKNSSKYSSEDLSTIKGKIRSAAKKFGIEISDK